MIPSTNHRYDVIVIGAGHNGLAAAGVLAKRGRKVLVLERGEAIGGLAVGDEFRPGYRSAGLLHETLGPSRELIETLGLEQHGLVWGDGPGPVFAPQVEGAGLLLHHDPGVAYAEIARHSKRDAERYGEYRAFLGRIAKFTGKVLHDSPPDVTADGVAGLWPLAMSGLALRRLGRADMLELMRIAPMCVADWLGEWFEGDLIKCALAHPAIAGSFTGPRSPGTSAVLVRHETLAGGAVRDGAASVVDALCSAARAMGAEIRTTATVERIRVSGGSVTGVTLAGGETIDSSVVASSCDPKRTMLELVGASEIATKLVSGIEAYRMRGTTAKVDLAIQGPLRFACRGDMTIERALVAETIDEMERAFDCVKYGLFSPGLILDVLVPTVSYPEWARTGDSVVSILAHFAPYDLRGGWTNDRREALGDAVVGRLDRYAPGIGGRILARRVMTPIDIERKYGVRGGQIHHGELSIDQMLVRPCPECARYATPVGGLYLCGSGTHPGGGAMGASGRNAALRMMQDSAR